jgi:hypothetical protein
MVLLTAKFLDVAKFTTLTPFSILILCDLSFLLIGLKISSLYTFSLKASCPVGTRGLSSVGKVWPGRDADYSPPSSADVVNE